MYYSTGSEHDTAGSIVWLRLRTAGGMYPLRRAAALSTGLMVASGPERTSWLCSGAACDRRSCVRASVRA